MNSFITFVVFATVLGMTGVNLSMSMITGFEQTAAQGMVAGFNSFIVLCLSVAGVGFILAFKSK